MVKREGWGTVLKSLREQKGLTQSELAARANLTRGYISRIEINQIKTSSRDTFSALAKGLGMTLDELNEAITGERLQSQPETTEQILERLRLATPISVPVFTDFAAHAGEPTEPVEYVYLPRTRTARKGIEAYIVHGECLSPSIEDKDIVVVDREASVDSGDIVACLFSGEMHLGKLRKIADVLFIENSHGRIELKDCQVAAPVIQVIRRLK